jgi:hypothetical protein
MKLKSDSFILKRALCLSVVVLASGQIKISFFFF